MTNRHGSPAGIPTEEARVRRQHASSRWLKNVGVRLAVAAALSVGVIGAALVVDGQPASQRIGGADAPPTASAPGSAIRPSATGSALTTGPAITASTPMAPPQLPVAYESSVLGYGIQLPEGYRRSGCLSRDTFTLLSVEQEQAQNWAHVARGGAVAMWTFQVTVWPADRTSAVDLAERRGCPQCERIASAAPSATDPLTGRRPTEERVESTVIDGREAARLLIDGEARLYVVRADDRLYVVELYYDPNVVTTLGLTRPTVLPLGIVDRVARTLRTWLTGPIPTPTPPPEAPTADARQLAAQLASALRAGDTGTLKRMAPSCWLRISRPSAGVLGLAVTPYLAELDRRFASGLHVSADPTVQVAPPDLAFDGRRLFLVSEWTEAGATNRADLFLDEEEGRWRWAAIRTYPP